MQNLFGLFARIIYIIFPRSQCNLQVGVCITRKHFLTIGYLRFWNIPLFYHNNTKIICNSNLSVLILFVETILATSFVGWYCNWYGNSLPVSIYVIFLANLGTEIAGIDLKGHGHLFAWNRTHLLKARLLFFIFIHLVL